MYTLHRLIAIMALLISPARIVATIPFTLPATEALASAQTAPYNLTLDTTKPSAVEA
jgi:hypothetical protein